MGAQFFRDGTNELYKLAKKLSLTPKKAVRS